MESRICQVILYIVDERFQLRLSDNGSIYLEWNYLLIQIDLEMNIERNQMVLMGVCSGFNRTEQES